MGFNGLPIAVMLRLIFGRHSLVSAALNSPCRFRIHGMEHGRRSENNRRARKYSVVRRSVGGEGGLKRSAWLTTG